MSPTGRFFGWVNQHARLVVLVVVGAALTLGAIAPTVADSNDPNFDPSGEIFDTNSRALDLLASESSLDAAAFLVESADGGDVLTADAMREWDAAASTVRDDPGHRAHLVTGYDAELGSEVLGVLSIVDAVDDQLDGGLATAADIDVKAALAEILDENAGTADMRLTLSEQATFTDGIWASPAFTATVTYDHDTFSEYIESELWLREVQADVQADAVLTAPIGIAIDFDQTFDEAIAASAPFIFLAVALIVLLVAIVHRSYWSAVMVGTGLGATMLAYNGVAALVGLKMGSLLLAFIVPIAMISFGVDFYIHGAERVREMQIERGMTRHEAYPAGMRAVFLALLLAVVSSIAAFLSNISSGTEAIIQFGIGAAISLALAYVILGLIAPSARRYRTDRRRQPDQGRLEVDLRGRHGSRGNHHRSRCNTRSGDAQCRCSGDGPRHGAPRGTTHMGNTSAQSQGRGQRSGGERRGQGRSPWTLRRRNRRTRSRGPSDRDCSGGSCDRCTRPDDRLQRGVRIRAEGLPGL